VIYLPPTAEEPNGEYFLHHGVDGQRGGGFGRLEECCESRKHLDVIGGGGMKADVVTQDCWIMGQLAGIHILERELTDALKRPGKPTNKNLQRRIAQLNSWLNSVDDALTGRPQEILSHRPA
jgi:hypothetical protein